MGPLQHDVDVGCGVVVAEDSRLLLCRIGEVGACGAQVDASGDGGVIDVVGVGDTVAVAIDTKGTPTGGDELHRAHRSIPDRVPIQLTMVGVGDGSDARRTVQPWAQDRSQGVTEGIEAPVAGMIGLDTPDPGQHRPRQVTARPDGRQGPLGELVGIKHHTRDP